MVGFSTPFIYKNVQQNHPMAIFVIVFEEVMNAACYLRLAFFERVRRFL